MTFCIRCATPPCPDAGIISVSIGSSSSARPLTETSCDSGNDPSYIPGPSVGNVTVQAYAFSKGSDAWSGVKCKGSAQASQTNIQRYDANDDIWYLIPSRIHKAQITGGLIGSGLVSMEKEFFSGKSYDAQLLAGGASIATEMVTQLGAKFKYNGPPIGIEIPNLGTFSIEAAGNITGALISSISVNVDYPNTPATVSYTFEFPLKK